ncbi:MULTISPECIES: hypothetical protein [unclassified Fusibacter]|uniref:hypothetical protein n=1 Tax=unclassified Fusibacter TaxID=2624464 RepID=UPI0010105B1B|nr:MULTISPECIES: hypothetical protein [unclassified Fusibacter]MCK8058303.1 hypothetical protein [Fusibacter sp. A2]NPE20886.1 hypothetical protein [Fusibacter sp. A1]RXV63090.1 hypothetical protein DWB64_03560 [Fusibacter sp. A1]
MSVHYGYNYKLALIKKLKSMYGKELEHLEFERAQRAQLDEAEDLILSFFGASKDELLELEVASVGEVLYQEYEDDYIVRLTIHENYIQFTRKPTAIEIELGQWNEEDQHAESSVVAYIIPGEKKCKLKKIGKVHDGSNFDENVINSYVRQAFESILEPDN